MRGDSALCSIADLEYEQGVELALASTQSSHHGIALHRRRVSETAFFVRDEFWSAPLIYFLSLIFAFCEKKIKKFHEKSFFSIPSLVQPSHRLIVI